MKFNKILLLLGIISLIQNIKSTRLRYCVEYIGQGSRANAQQYDDGDDSSDYDVDQREVLNKTLKPGVRVCDSRMDSCYSVWTSNENGTINLVSQGCWQSDACETAECISDKSSYNQQTLHKFCCCNEDYCNKNFSMIEIKYEESTNISTPPFVNWLNTYSPAIWICSSITAIIMMSLIFLLICRLTPKTEPELAPLAPSGPGYSSNLHNVDNLKLCAMIGQGKYGTVWKGMINEKPVAVKIFPGQYKQYFLNERDIYTSNLMDSPNLLSYFGCDQRRTMDDNIEYLIVLSLAPLGCLQDWLVDNTTSFEIFYKMSKSIAHGISHLHSQIIKGDIVKPCICHRDLNSRNILVKPDLSCCICDFGFALKTFGPRYEYKGEMTLAETKSINEVGTLRYMAPEILEGAVNLRDCESALKQIDVYALGLILWELCTRCHDLYQNGNKPPQYQAPYEAETGKNPTYEQMQVLVSRHKARPLFPPFWGGSSAATLAKDTCEDCWDHDAEARLTALCVEERLHEISLLKPSSSDNNTSINISNNNLFQSIISSNNNSPSPTSLNKNFLIFTPNTINLITAPPNQIIPNIINENTDETMISTTPSNEWTPQKYNNLPRKNGFKYKTNTGNGFCNADKSTVVNGFNESPTTSTILKNNLNGKLHNGNINDRKKPGWNGVRTLIHTKLFKKNSHNILYDIENSEKSNLVENQKSKVEDQLSNTTPTKLKSTHTHTGGMNGRINSNNHIVDSTPLRPKNLNIQKSHNKNLLNNNSSSVSQSNDSNSSLVSNSPNKVNNYNLFLKMNLTESNNENFEKFKFSPTTGQTFTIIKPTKKLNTDNIHNDSESSNNSLTMNSRLVGSKSANAVKNLSNVELLNEKLLKRQRSLEIFREVFNNSKGSLERLRDPSQRVKTPGDVPPSVRKVRASKTLSLYDDRMMDASYELGCGFYGSEGNGGNTL